VITVGFVCTRCGLRFETQVFDKGEAESKRIRGSPVRCPECGSIKVERR